MSDDGDLALFLSNLKKARRGWAQVEDSVAEYNSALDTRELPGAAERLRRVLADEDTLLGQLVASLSSRLYRLVGADAHGQPFSCNSEVATLLEDQWALVTVEDYDGARGLYTLRDPEPQAGQNPLFTAHSDVVVGFYDWEHDPNAPTFPKGLEVLALWPETTIFYKGKVIEEPYRGAVCCFPPPPSFFLFFFFSRASRGKSDQTTI